MSSGKHSMLLNLQNAENEMAQLQSQVDRQQIVIENAIAMQRRNSEMPWSCRTATWNFSINTSAVKTSGPTTGLHRGATAPACMAT